MRDEPGEESSANSSGGSAKANDRADAGRGKHVGRSGEEVRGPALMGGRGEAEQSDGGPGVGGKECVHVGNKHDGHDANGADQEGELAARVDAVSAIHAEAGEPSAGNGAETCSRVNDDERIFDVV